MGKETDEEITQTTFLSDNQEHNIILLAQLMKPRTNVSDFSFKVLYD